MLKKNLVSTASIAALLHAAAPAGVIGAVRAEAGDDGDLTQLMTEVKQELRRVGNNAIQKADALGKEVDKISGRLESLENRNHDLEQKLAARRGGGGGTTRGAFVEAVVGSDMAREVLAGISSVKRGSFTVSAAILSSPPLVDADRRPEIVASVQRALRVRDLLVVTPTGEGSIEYLRETGFTNGASVVSEGAEKPETTLELELVNAPMRTIAHWTRATKQVLADVRRLATFIDRRMWYGVQLEEDAQLLLGDGTGQNLAGIMIEATAYNPPAGIPISNAADQIGAAIAQLRAIDHEPDGVVMHATDWQALLQEKGEDGHYLIPGGPFSTAAPALHGKPVALTTALDVGDFLVGQFAVGAELFEREEATVDISTEDRDNFIKNLATIRAEERVQLAIYRPEAFVAGEFTAFT